MTLPDMKIEIHPEDSHKREPCDSVTGSLSIPYFPIYTPTSNLALPELLFTFLGFTLLGFLQKVFLIPSSGLGTCLKRFQGPQDLTLA